MPYVHHGEEQETSGGVLLVSGISEWEEARRIADEANPIKWGAWDTTGWDKLDYIANGLHTEESFKQAVHETTLRMILKGARRLEDGGWILDTGGSVWNFHAWCWTQPYSGYNKRAVERLRLTKPFPVTD